MDVALSRIVWLPARRDQALPPPPAADLALVTQCNRETKVCVIDNDAPMTTQGALAAPRIPAPRAIISMDEAKRLFSELSQLTFMRSDKQLELVPFDYPTDGCYFRAHLMAQRLALRGVSVGKVFAQGHLQVPSALAGDAPAGQPGVVRWGWHVAPVIQARDDKGVVLTYVMDPSLAKEPVTVDRWNEIMGGKASISFGNANAYYPNEANPTQATSSAHQAAALGRLTRYADLAPLHQLAADIRRALAEPGTCGGRNDKARALLNAAPADVRARFAFEYPTLSQLLRC